MGLLLFLVLINDVGFQLSRGDLKRLNELHLKYVDDFTLAEAVDLKSQLRKDSVAVLPAQYHMQEQVAFYQMKTPKYMLS